MGKNIHEMVTDKIIEKLEQGIVPWRKPWRNGGAVNWKTQKPYRGINCMLLADGEYATFKQITEAGGKVKKGAKSEIVVFWKWIEKEENGEKERIPLLRYYNVFNVLTQAEGLESKREEQTFDHNPIEACENIIKGYIGKPKMFNLRDGAWYKPLPDYINVPPISDFPNVEEYYATTFHEMIHSTGHSDRLNREGINTVASFGSEDYSKEELVAEIGAAMLSGVAMIDMSTFENSVSYINSWLKVLKNDKTLLVKAGSQSQKAVDYILGTKWEEA
jgi:antirestriction protein ArdC